MRLIGYPEQGGGAIEARSTIFGYSGRGRGGAAIKAYGSFSMLYRLRLRDNLVGTTYTLIMAYSYQAYFIEFFILPKVIASSPSSMPMKSTARLNIGLTNTKA